MIKNDASQNNERENEKDVIFGRNSVAEAIKSGRPLDSVMVARGDRSGSIPKIVADAKKAGIVIKEVDSKKLDFICGHNNHQGIAAMGAVKEYSSIEDIFATAEERNESPFIIICDEIEDPHNLGSILRVSECAGVDGVIIGKRRSAQVNETVMRVSEGSANHIDVARVTNINATIDTLKDNGFWTYALEIGGSDIYKTDLKGKIAIVVGGEDTGVNRLTKEKCDAIITIPMKGKVNSLNASVACGVAVFEALRQRI